MVESSCAFMGTRQGVRERGPRMGEDFESIPNRPGRLALSATPPKTSNSPIKEAFEYYTPLARVRRFVEGNLDEDLSLTEASRIARLSPKYFSAFFKRHTGIHFRDWVTEVRIQRAKTLLAEKNRAIVQVAFAVGFKDVRTFQRSFKKVTGMTPIAFKRSVAP